MKFDFVIRYYILGAIFGNANTGEYFNTPEFITFFSYQIAVHFLSVLAIVYVSSAVTKESEKTAIRVHKLLNVTKNEVLKFQLTQFSMQLLHRKIKFTACNLFPLDTSLIFTVSFLLISWSFVKACEKVSRFIKKLMLHVAVSFILIEIKVIVKALREINI